MEKRIKKTLLSSLLNIKHFVHNNNWCMRKYKKLTFYDFIFLT